MSPQGEIRSEKSRSGSPKPVFFHVSALSDLGKSVKVVALIASCYQRIEPMSLTLGMWIGSVEEHGSVYRFKGAAQNSDSDPVSFRYGFFDLASYPDVSPGRKNRHGLSTLCQNVGSVR